MRAGWLAVVLVASFATGCGGHGRAAGTTIVFQSDRGGREALYAVRPDGRGLTKLPVEIRRDAGVSWTRDGTEALVSYDKGSGKTVTYIFEAASGARRPIRLPGLDWGSDMPWSPDGKRLVLYTRYGYVVLDVKTGRQDAIDSSYASDTLAWSPDGKHLLFPSAHSVYSAPADGGPATQLLTIAHLRPTELHSSSDGKWLSFVDSAERDRLYAVCPDGTGLRLIARDYNLSSAWSPSGELLAFADSKGIGLVDLANGRRRRLTGEHLDDPSSEGPAWSPDGRRILYLRNDLGHEPLLADLQLWTMKADGSDRHPVTHAFPADGQVGSAEWVEGTLEGTPLPSLPLVSLTAARTITTGRPIVELAAEGNRAAALQGYLGGPSGPIVIWNRVRGTRLQIPVRGCISAYELALGAGGVGYLCNHSRVDFATDEGLRLLRPGRRGATGLAHAYGDEFSGLFLGGLAGDGDALAFDVGELHGWPGPSTRTRIWEATAARKAIVRRFQGLAPVIALDAGRIVVLRGRQAHAVSVIFPRGGTRTFAFGRGRVLDAKLDGTRLVVLQSTRVTVVDLGSGRRRTSWPVRQALGPASELEDAHGDLAVYVAGLALHVLRLSDGREFVIDTPNAAAQVSARFAPGGLFYSFNEAYAKRAGRLVFVTRAELERILASRPATH